MKAQMRFQKIMCLIMIIVGALGLLYAFFYLSGAMTDLSWSLDPANDYASTFKAAEGKEDATLFVEIQSFNNVLMYCGIAMILLAVVLYITSTQKRRNYYPSNFVATGLCAGGNIVMSIVLIVMNALWRSRFLNLDFAAWKSEYQLYFDLLESRPEYSEFIHYSEATAWFDVGFAVYAIIIVASIFLILNLVWKIKLMQGERQLLAKSQQILAGGETV